MYFVMIKHIVVMKGGDFACFFDHIIFKIKELTMRQKCDKESILT